MVLGRDAGRGLVPPTSGGNKRDSFRLQVLRRQSYVSTRGRGPSTDRIQRMEDGNLGKRIEGGECTYY